MTRLTVFQLRLLGSTALLVAAFGLVRLLWYPGAYFAISGALTQFLVLAAVVVIIGPVLSAFVYKPGKSGLAFDLGILLGVELLAIFVAMTLLYQRQPHFAVFAVDRFEAIARGEVNIDEVPAAIDASRPGHAPRLVYARMPEDPDVKNRLIDETVFMGMADIDRRPEFWEPYARGIPVVRQAGRPLDTLLQGSPEQQRAAARWLSSTGSSASDYVYLPLRGRAGDAAIILHAEIGFPVATLRVDPW